MYTFRHPLHLGNLREVFYRYYVESWLEENCTDWTLKELDNSLVLEMTEEDAVLYSLSPISDGKNPL